MLEVDLLRHTAVLGESAPLPSTLQSCLVERAKELARDPTDELQSVVLYLSLSPEP